MDGERLGMKSKTGFYLPVHVHVLLVSEFSTSIWLTTIVCEKDFSINKTQGRCSLHTYPPCDDTQRYSMREEPRGATHHSQALQLHASKISTTGNVSVFDMGPVDLPYGGF